MHKIDVSLVFLTRGEQSFIEMSVERGTNAGELISKSGWLTDVSELADKDLRDLELGVYAHKIDADYLLEDGDRVEIYRPLSADPKEVRRQLALLGKTIGKK